MIPVRVGDFVIGKGQPLALIAGPCVLESLDDALAIAEFVKGEADKRGMPFIFKASYEKDNRGKPTGYAGPGLDKGLEMLATIKARLGVPVLSDVHRETDVDAAAQVLDVIQIPAYLCQQTSLVLKVGQSGRVVNVKKGQFLAPEDMASAVAKLRHVGNDQILLTDRGTSFGYHRLVFDPRSVPIMQTLGHPVVVDPTHMVRVYGRSSADPAGGEPEFVATLARAGVAAGANAIFLETHPTPFSAACDAASMICMGDELPEVLDQILPLAQALRERGIA